MMAPGDIPAWAAIPVALLLITGGAVVTCIAYRVMLRIGALPTEARWFA